MKFIPITIKSPVLYIIADNFTVYRSQLIKKMRFAKGRMYAVKYKGGRSNKIRHVNA